MQRAFGGDHHSLHHTAGPPSSSSSGDVFNNHQPYYGDQSFYDPSQYNNYHHHHHNHFVHFNGGPGFASSHHGPFPGRKRAWNQSNQDNVNVGKLYVAQVPRTATEQDIQPVFGQYGSILEVVLLKDKNTGHQQGSCFVKFATVHEANNAVAALNNNYTFPGEMAPVTVRFANNRERERPGIMVQEKVYVTMLNKEAPVEEIEEIFSPYGAIEEVYIVRDEMKQSRGCGFVKFTHIEMARAAIEGLNGNYTMRGCDRPLIVRFAEPRKHRPGEFRGNGMCSGTNLGPDYQESNFSCRQTNYPGDFMFGYNQPTPMHTMQQFSSTSQPHEALNQEPQQYYQKPSQPIPNPDTTSRSYQPTSIPDSQKQDFQVKENQVQDLHQQHSHTSLHQPTPTRSRPQEVAGNSAVSTNSEEILECDWSEHTCPDGYKYYYNCVSCESLWNKPKEFALYEEQLNKKNPCFQNHSPSPILSPLHITPPLDDEEQNTVVPDELQFEVPSMPILDHVEVQ